MRKQGNGRVTFLDTESTISDSSSNCGTGTVMLTVRRELNPSGKVRERPRDKRVTDAIVPSYLGFQLPQLQLPTITYGSKIPNENSRNKQ